MEKNREKGREKMKKRNDDFFVGTLTNIKANIGTIYIRYTQR